MFSVIFPGQGSQMIGMGKEFFEKYEIVKALQSGKLDALICTDAASEGLNLQAASVVINVDVPWNPARLLQRFGNSKKDAEKMIKKNYKKKCKSSL